MNEEQSFFLLDSDGDRLIGVNAGLGLSSLSCRQKGIVLTVLSQPSGWRASAQKMREICGLGRDSLAADLAALVEAGFCFRERQNDRMSGQVIWRYKFRSNPPPPEFQGVVKIENLNVVIQTNHIWIANDSLLTAVEEKAILTEAAQLPPNRAQLLVDELIGSLRSRGKNPPNARGIRNVLAYFSTIKGGTEFHYAAAEKQLRENRKNEKNKQCFERQSDTSIRPPSAKILRDLQNALLGLKNGK